MPKPDSAEEPEQDKTIRKNAPVVQLTSHSTSTAGTVLQAQRADDAANPLFIRLQNMSCTANLGVRLDLKKIALQCRNTEYNPRRFAAVIMRIREPRSTALLFQSGKMVVTGITNTHNASLAAQTFAYIVSRCGFQAENFLDFRVQNICGTTDVGFPIRLEGLVHAHSVFASYEPELFPGLIYRMTKPRVVLLIFVSGKIVLTGAKKEEHLVEALEKMYPVLSEFKKATTGLASGKAPPASATGNRAEV